MATFKVQHTRTFDCRPLAVLEGRVFNGLELTPGRLRKLASALYAVATDCETNFRESGGEGEARRTYDY